MSEMVTCIELTMPSKSIRAALDFIYRLSRFVLEFLRDLSRR